MFEKPIEYAPDLEWLIQSNQAPDDVILEGLVQEFYPSVYHLALSILDSRPAARNLAAEIFARALNERHTYRPQPGVKFWLMRIALDSCLSECKRLHVRRTFFSINPMLHKADSLGDSQPTTALDADIWIAVDKLEEPARSLALAHYLHSWTVPDLEQLLETPNGEVITALERTRQSVLAGLLASEVRSGREQPPDPVELDELLRASLQRRWSRPDFTEAQLDQIARKIAPRVFKKRGRRRVFVGVLEIAVILLIIIFAAALFWGADRLFPEPTPTPPTGASVYVTRIVAPTPRKMGAAQPALTPPAARQSIPQSGAYSLQDGDTWETVAVAMGVSVTELIEFNRIPLDEQPSAGREILNPREWPDVPAPTVLPRLGGPIGERMDMPRALDHAPRYQTLWIDALALDYGPDGYSGPARVVRVQAWIAPPARLVLSGPAFESMPEEVQLTTLGRDRSAFPRQEPPGPGAWRTTRSQPARTSLSPTALLASLVERGDLSVQQPLREISREEIAGIDSVVVDQYWEDGSRYSRFWLDDRTGLVLRRVFYRYPTMAIAHEYRVLQVAYDFEPPADLLTDRLPWRGGYAADETGRAEDESPYNHRIAILPQLSDFLHPPTDFDPSGAELTFLYPQDYLGEGPATTYVFADNYFLTHFLFGDPWKLSCRRSPDGRWLAFVSNPDAPPGGLDSTLYWYPLEVAPGGTSASVGFDGVSDMAFSPDSRKLAYFQRDHSVDQPGVLGVLDLESGKATALMALTAVRSLVWDEHGGKLAMIARLAGNWEEEYLLIVNPHTPNQIFLAVPEDATQPGDEDWPFTEWGVEFPVGRGSLEQCAAAPKD